jgi:two-component system CheB/CheR fusion protein
VFFETNGGLKPVRVVASVQDVSERKATEVRQTLLLRELSHRVKNTLAVVQSVARQTLRGRGDTEDAFLQFGDRLAALARAHDLLVKSEWRGAEFHELALNQLRPYLGKDESRLRLGGPELLLPSRTATGFALLLHELATNASKHGALSRAGGSVSLTWNVAKNNPTDLLHVVWQEHGGPVVDNPQRRGFGTFLIEQGMPEAQVKREFRPSGLACTIELPLPKAYEGGA